VIADSCGLLAFRLSDAAWTLLQIGLGGYVVGRSVEKIALALIEHHEGRRAFPYYESVGKISIGIGRNLADRGLSDDEISLLFLNDMRLSRQICQQLFVNFDSIAPTRQAALLLMAFNLGTPRLGKLHNLRAAIAADDWRLAAA
jgi:lysozyme